MEEYNIPVYVKIDDNQVIKEINSGIFLQDTTGYTLIDAGQGDKYSHAQNQYLEKGLANMSGEYNYKLVDNKVVELSNEEKIVLFPKPAPVKSELELLKEAVQSLLTANLGV